MSGRSPGQIATFIFEWVRSTYCTRGRRGMVNRTYGTGKNIDIYHFSLKMFGPIYYVMVPRNRQPGVALGQRRVAQRVPHSSG